MDANKKLEIIIGVKDTTDFKKIERKVQSFAKGLQNKKFMFGLDTNTMSKDLKRFSNSTITLFKGLGNSAGAALGAGIKTGLTVGVAGLGAIGAGAGLGIKLAGDFEQTSIAFKTMLGDGKKAGDLLTSISKFSAETPFEFPEIADAGKKLLAFGFSAQDVIPNLTRLGDVAAGLSIPIGELSEIYGKAKVQGRLYGEDINQLTGRGIPVIQEFAKQFKVSDSEVKGLVEDGKIGFKELEIAIKSLTDKGSKFGGGMKNQSESLNGLFSTLKDNSTNLLREIIGIDNAGNIAKGSIIEKFKSVTNFLIDWTNKNKERIKSFVMSIIKSVESFFSKKFNKESLVKAFDYFKTNLPIIKDGFVKVGTALSQIGEVAITLLPYIVGIADRTGNFISNNPELATAAGIFILMVNPITTIARFISGFGPIVAPIAVIAASMKVIFDNWNDAMGYFGIVIDENRERLKPMLDMVKEIWSYIEPIVSGIGKLYGDSANILGLQLQKTDIGQRAVGTWESLKEGFGLAGQGVKYSAEKTMGQIGIPTTQTYNPPKNSTQSNATIININGVSTVDTSSVEKLRRLIEVTKAKAAS